MGRLSCNGWDDGALRLVDMHCHLDFLADPVAFARQAARRGVGFFAATVTPGGFERAAGQLAGCGNVRVGVGLHPWWVDDGRCGAADAERACQLVRETRYVGEVGLDFGKARVASRDAQVMAFERIARACAREGGKLLTVHAVRSAQTVLDVLERCGALGSNQVVFHWFSDSSDALWRAVRAGCSFSVNARMLATRRGREYARVIPRDRLLLETDLPPESDPAYGLDAWVGLLQDALRMLEDIRGEELGETLAGNGRRLLRP